MQTTIRQLPSGITRYDGTAPIAAVDAAGNVFHAIQGPEDSSMCIMAPADGSPTRRVGPIITKGGRPGLLCDPFVGLWLIGNKEAGGRVLPPLYPIAEFVTRSAAAPGGVAPEKAEPLPNGGQPYANNFDVFGDRRTDLTPLSAWADFLRLGLFVARFNKLAAGLAQIQRVLKKAGLLE